MNANTAKKTKWYMSDAEIARSYRNCADAKAQVGILAELNCRSKTEVKEKLKELGLIRSRNDAQRFTEEDDKRIWKMRHDEQRPYTIIAKAIGKSSMELVRNEYQIMHRKRLDARGLIEAAVRFYIKSGKTTEKETELLKELTRRGI